MGQQYLFVIRPLGPKKSADQIGALPHSEE